MTYKEFIDNIIITRGRFGISDGEYKERHHIQLESLCGPTVEENLIDLYAHEHFIAHKLLYEENPHNSKIAYAYWMMAHGCKTKDQDRYECTPEEYEDAKIAFVNAIKGREVSDETRQKISKANSNPSFETREKMREAKKDLYNGENNPFYNKHHNENAKEKISIANTGRVHSTESRQKISVAQKGKYVSEDTRKRMSKNHANVSGANNPAANHPIYCVELNEIFYGSKDAEDKYGIKAPNIIECCKGRRKSAGKHPTTKEKLHWYYVDDLDTMEVAI